MNAMIACLWCSEMKGSCSSEDNGVVVLGYGPCRLVSRHQRFRETYCLPSLGLEVGTACFSETFEYTQEPVRRQNPEQQHRHTL
jgi:hypothetical protein